jgi:hypothetical protein
LYRDAAQNVHRAGPAARRRLQSHAPRRFTAARSVRNAWPVREHPVREVRARDANWQTWRRQASGPSIGHTGQTLNEHRPAIRTARAHRMQHACNARFALRHLGETAADTIREPVSGQQVF